MAPGNQGEPVRGPDVDGQETVNTDVALSTSGVALRSGGCLVWNSWQAAGAGMPPPWNGGAGWGCSMLRVRSLGDMLKHVREEWRH